MNHEYILSLSGYNNLKNKEYTYTNTHPTKELAFREAITFKRNNISIYEYKIVRQLTLF